MVTIAEIGQAHYGSLGLLYSYVDALSETGVDAVKFQVHIAHAESSKEEPFRVNFSKQDETRYDYWKRMEFTEKQWHDLFEHVKSLGLQFVVSVFSVEAFKIFDSLPVDAFKIASGEVSNLLLLDYIRNTSTKVIMSSGLSNYEELKTSYDFLREKNDDIDILHCVSMYPTPLDKVGLNVIGELKELFPQARIGLSDHSANLMTLVSAYHQGASVFEFHTVFDKKMFGPDTSSSYTIDEIGDFVKNLNDLKAITSNETYKEDLINREIKGTFGKSLCVNKDLKKGHSIQKKDLDTKKPSGYGVSASNYQEIIGKSLVNDKKAWEFLKSNELE